MSTISRTVRNGSTPVDCSTMPICRRSARSPLRRVEPEHPDLARAAVPVALEDLGGRRLAGAVRPEEREHLTPVDVQVDAGHRLDVAVGLAEPSISITRSDTPRHAINRPRTPRPVSTRLRSGSPRANRPALSTKMPTTSASHPSTSPHMCGRDAGRWASSTAGCRPAAAPRRTRPEPAPAIVASLERVDQARARPPSPPRPTL